MEARPNPLPGRLTGGTGLHWGRGGGGWTGGVEEIKGDQVGEAGEEAWEGLGRE